MKKEYLRVAQTYKIKSNQNQTECKRSVNSAFCKCVKVSSRVLMILHLRSKMDCGYSSHKQYHQSSSNNRI